VTTKPLPRRGHRSLLPGIIESRRGPCLDGTGGGRPIPTRAQQRSGQGAPGPSRRRGDRAASCGPPDPLDARWLAVPAHPTELMRRALLEAMRAAHFGIAAWAGWMMLCSGSSTTTSL
jgi:hypothetical protein